MTESLWWYMLIEFINPENNAWALQSMVTCIALIVFMVNHIQIRNASWRMENPNDQDTKITLWSDIKQLFKKR